MRYSFLLVNKPILLVLVTLNTIILKNLEILKILEDNELTIHHLESDLCKVIENITLSNIYKECIIKDIMHWRDSSVIDLSDVIIRFEIELILQEIRYAIDKINIKNKRLISISLDFPNTLSLEYI